MEHGGGTGAVLIERRTAIVRTVGETGSTNADLVALARSGEADGTWLRAERQSDGRGRQGRDWQSPAGNLYASTLIRLRPGDPPAATLALVAAVALDEAVATFLPGRARLKWPNDLMIDGAKLSGILLERSDDAVVVGFGVNLMHHPDIAGRRTTSLAAHGIAVEAATFVDVLAESFLAWLSRWRNESLARVRSRWLERAHPIGTALTARLADDTAVDGLFDGLGDDGGLHLRLASGERRVIHAADVFLL